MLGTKIAADTLAGPREARPLILFDETGELRSLRLRLASEAPVGPARGPPVPVTVARARGSRPWIYNSPPPPPPPPPCTMARIVPLLAA